MYAGDGVGVGQGRLAPLKRQWFERVEHGLQAPGMFGVPGRRFVAQHGGVSEEQHADDVAPTAARAKCGV
jgi:hypothetical protein